MNKNPPFLLYKLEPLKRLEETILKKEKTKEEYIKKLFGENLSKIFSNLIFLREEYYLLNPDTKQKDCIADTLAFSKRDKCFVIIEYKREDSHRLYEQTQSYMSCLDDENTICIVNRFKLLEALKEKVKNWKYEDINWEETKGMCITPEIHKDLIHHKRKPKNKNIAIIEIKFYDDKKILWIDTANLPEWLQITSAERNDEENKETKSDTNQGIVDIYEVEVSKWLEEIEDCIYSLKPLEKKVWEKEGYWPRIRYYDKVLNKVLVSLIAKTKKINVYWNFENPQEISQNLKNLLETYDINHSEKDHGVGKGNWFFSIENKISLQKLKDFITEYKKTF